MRRTTMRQGLLAAALLSALAAPSGAEQAPPLLDPEAAETTERADSADEEGRAGGAASGEQGSDARWIPAVSMFSSGFFQDRDAKVDSVQRGKFDDSSRAVFWSVGLSAELSTPVLWDVPGRPRLFGHVDVSLSFDNSDPVVNEGDPGKPQVLSTVIGQITPLGGVTGRGSATRVETEPLVLSAGLGMSFGMDVWGRALRIKPSIEWQLQEDRVRVLLGDAEALGPDPTLCEPCRTVSIDADRYEYFHSLGPGIELELETVRWNDVMLTVYSGFTALAVVGERDVEVRGSGDWEIDGMPSGGTVTVESKYKRDRWSYRAGIGVRFLWQPN